MINNSIGYHTRLDSNNTVKVCGGSFGGTIDMLTVERLVNAHFSVVIKNSGRAVFVDKEGREVSVYITVDPLKTTRGVEAKREYDKRRLQAQAEEDDKAEEVQSLLEGLTHEEAIRRLRG